MTSKSKMNILFSRKTILLLMLGITVMVAAINCSDKKIIAVVGSEKITEGDLKSVLKTGEEKDLETILEKLIDEKLLLLEAEELKLSEKEPLSGRLKDARYKLARKYLAEKVVGEITVTEEELKEYYKKNQKKLKTEFEEAKSIIEEEVKREKGFNKIKKYIESVKKDYSIEIDDDLMNDPNFDNPNTSLVVATVNNKAKITNNEVKLYVRRKYKELKTTPELRKDAVDNLLISIIWRLEYEKYVNTKYFEEDYKKMKNSMVLFFMRTNYIINQIQVMEEEIEEYYNEHISDYRIEPQVSVRHILFDNLDKAVSVLSKIRGSSNPSNTFKYYAKVYAKGPPIFRELAGDLGFITKNVMSNQFDEIAFTLEKGEIGGPAKSEYGYHLIMVEERKQEDYVPIEQVKENIKREIYSNKRKGVYTEYILGLREKYKDLIKVYIGEDYYGEKKEEEG